MAMPTDVIMEGTTANDDSFTVSTRKSCFQCYDRPSFGCKRLSENKAFHSNCELFIWNGLLCRIATLTFGNTRHGTMNFLSVHHLKSGLWRIHKLATGGIMFSEIASTMRNLTYFDAWCRNITNYRNHTKMHEVLGWSLVLSGKRRMNVSVGKSRGTQACQSDDWLKRIEIRWCCINVHVVIYESAKAEQSWILFQSLPEIDRSVIHIASELVELTENVMKKWNWKEFEKFATRCFKWFAWRTNAPLTMYVQMAFRLRQVYSSILKSQCEWLEVDD